MPRNFGKPRPENAICARRIRCSGALHWVWSDANGHLHYPHATKSKEVEEVSVALGGKETPCLKLVRDIIKTTYLYTIPIELADFELFIQGCAKNRKNRELRRSTATKYDNVEVDRIVNSETERKHNTMREIILGRIGFPKTFGLIFYQSEQFNYHYWFQNKNAQFFPMKNGDIFDNHKKEIIRGNNRRDTIDPYTGKYMVIPKAPDRDTAYSRQPIPVVRRRRTR